MQCESILAKKDLLIINRLTKWFSRFEGSNDAKGTGLTQTKSSKWIAKKNIKELWLTKIRLRANCKEDFF